MQNRFQRCTLTRIQSSHHRKAGGWCGDIDCDPALYYLPRVADAHRAAPCVKRPTACLEHRCDDER